MPNSLRNGTGNYFGGTGNSGAGTGYLACQNRNYCRMRISVHTGPTCEQRALIHVNSCQFALWILHGSFLQKPVRRWILVSFILSQRFLSSSL